jgi:hypothetical protein
VFAFIHAWSGQSGSGFFPQVGAATPASPAVAPALVVGAAEAEAVAEADADAEADGAALADAVAVALSDAVALGGADAVGADVVALGVVSAGFLSSHAADNAAVSARTDAKRRCVLSMATDSSKESDIPRPA